MANHNSAFLFAMLFSFMLFANGDHRDDDEVEALKELYSSLNTPSFLNWNFEGGGPCKEHWKGIYCHQSSVVSIKLQGLSLTGNIGDSLYGLQNLRKLDLSSNSLSGEIPNTLPYNLTDLNLAHNRFNHWMPKIITSMIHLRHLNLSRNLLSGPLPRVFDFKNIIMMDLSYNNFSGDLPVSFCNLLNLTRLHLQGNKLSGSIVFLASLHLHDLNIENNLFSGIIPEALQKINNLRIGGNLFHIETCCTPGKLSPDMMQPRSKKFARMKVPVSVVVIVPFVCLVLTISIAVIYISVKVYAYPSSNRCSYRATEGTSVDENLGNFTDHSSSTMSSPRNEFCPLISIQKHPVRLEMMSSRHFFFKKGKVPMCIKFYTTAELQLATSNFSPNNLLGEGTLGPVYRADFPDGQILAVQNISVALTITEDQFTELAQTLCHLRHPYIVALVGYSVGKGDHLLCYEYIGKVTLDEALHNVLPMPLSWVSRLNIAHGVSLSLDYLHTSYVPSITHSNIKASNILLDEDLNPHLCDCGLAVLKPLATNHVQIQASVIAIADSGYVAPEHVKHERGEQVADDVFCFGVLLLELLTGRQDFNRALKGKESPVEWVSYKLQSKKSLVGVADRNIRRDISSMEISSYLNIVSQCIQHKKQLRPQMAGIAKQLELLLHTVSTLGKTESRKH